MTYPPEELPPHDQLADDEDQLDWDSAELGPMAAAAQPDDVVETEPYDPDNDPFLQEG